MGSVLSEASELGSFSL